MRELVKASEYNKATIYKITTLDGEVYVGQTTKFNARMSKHKECSLKNKQPVSLAIGKCGFNNCIIEILEVVNIDKKLEREMYWISYFKSNFYRYPNNKGLNSTDGGLGCGGFVASEDLKAKLSKCKTGRKVSQEVKDHLKNYNSDIIVDKTTGIFFTGLKEACQAYKMNLSTLHRYLSGSTVSKKNPTNLQYA